MKNKFNNFNDVHDKSHNEKMCLLRQVFSTIENYSELKDSLRIVAEYFDELHLANGEKSDAEAMDAIEKIIKKIGA